LRYKFTDAEIKKIQDNLTVIVDSREQRNEHIIWYFDKKRIPYKVMKNDFGDYSCFIPKGTIDRFTSDIYFDRDIAIERKANIDEVAGNLKGDAARLTKELAHMNKYNIKYFVFLEDANYYDNLINGNYRSEYDANTLDQRIEKGVLARYDTILVPIDKKYIGRKIINVLRSYVYELFKNKGFIEESESEEIE
jgi:ERCC4-type nuclease